MKTEHAAADKAQGWTHEKLQGLLRISHEDRYVTDDAFGDALDEINASITAEREKWTKRHPQGVSSAALIESNELVQQLREQLAAAQAEIRQHNNALAFPDCHRDIPLGDTTALDAAIAAAQKPLVDALTKLLNITEKPTQQWKLREWTGKVWCAHVNEMCKDALAKVKDGNET